MYLESAARTFQGTGINITADGRKHLGAVIGTEQYKKEYIGEKVQEWVGSMKILTTIAKTQPQAAYCCFVKGFVHKFTYFMRTIPNISELLYPLDAAIDCFIKAVFDDYEFSPLERKLWSLPVRMGGMGLPVPSEISNVQYQNSRIINAKLTAKVCAQQKEYEDISAEVNKAKREATLRKNERYDSDLQEILTQLGSSDKAKALEAAREKGASNWLNALPLRTQGYALDKQSFRDAIFTRYGIALKRLPSHCVCGEPFSVEHALNCKKGGFISWRHNDVRKITADLLREVCIDVEEEPLLLEITGEVFRSKTAKVEKDARLDISARGFWMRGQKVFCDVRVFNPLTKCHRTKTLAKVHELNEKEKKVKYAARVVDVENGSFTPLVFSCFGGMSRECGLFYKRLSEKLAEKRNMPTSEATCYIRTKISFSLIKAVVLCIRGSRGSRDKPCPVSEVDIPLTNEISGARK